MGQITITEIANTLGLPRTTIHRYLTRHQEYIPITRHGRKILINDEAVSLIKEIRQQYDKGLDADQVDNYLSDNLHLPAVITIDTNQDHKQLLPAQAMSEMVSLLMEIKQGRDQSTDELKQELSSLREETASLKRTIQRLEQKMVDDKQPGNKGFIRKILS